VMAWLLIFVGFLAPFLLLLSLGVKKRGKADGSVCCGVLVIQTAQHLLDDCAQRE